MLGVPREHSAQSASPSFPTPSSQSSRCQPCLCLPTPFLGLLLSQGPSPGGLRGRALPPPSPARPGALPGCGAPSLLLCPRQVAPSLGKPLSRGGCQGLDVLLLVAGAWWSCVGRGAAAWGCHSCLGTGRATWGPVGTLWAPCAGRAAQEGTAPSGPAHVPGCSPCPGAPLLCPLRGTRWPWLPLPLAAALAVGARGWL